jgi:hypothetical protein
MNNKVEVCNQWKNARSVGAISRIAALSAGPYSYMISVLGETLRATSSKGSMMWVLVFSMYIVGTVIASIISVKLAYMRKYDTFIERDRWVQYLTNIVHTMATTTLVIHVSGPHEPFLLMVAIITVRLQQTLSNRYVEPFTGIMVGIIMVSLWSTSMVRDTDIHLDVQDCILTPENTKNVNYIGIMLLCVIIGLATHVHIAQIVVVSIIEKDQTIGTLFLTWLLHMFCFLSTSLWSVLGTDHTPFFTRVCDNLDGGFVRLVLTITSLLLSTAPTVLTGAYGIMVGETACVCIVLILTIEYPAYATISILATYAIIMISIVVLTPVIQSNVTHVYQLIHYRP